MSYPPYESYLSNFDSLVFDSPSEAVQSEKDVADELDLWSNAQFTFDVKPGVGIYDEEKTKLSSKNTTSSPTHKSASQFESASGLDPITYDTLVNYLDYELPRQQQEQDSFVASETAKSPPASTVIATVPVKKQRIQPRPLAPARPVLAPHITPIARQVLMPKPPTTNINANILSSLLATATSSPNIPSAADCPSPMKNVATKRTIAEAEQSSNETTNPDEDKRRRNTAASARFRVKKKIREQAMEQSVREMTEKSDKLQDRVNNLEAEIKYLRTLLLDKAAHD
ncbi:hypothetical protein [Parasitella parasitica]|uniref:BZIP domain-containing protein n=1 Tax=Parasitella parasitica TaxID=35722 RepID=A0A0B7N6M9_9FUNG|nr:hypothetical protein [Parasitella parasitica]